MNIKYISFNIYVSLRTNKCIVYDFTLLHQRSFSTTIF